MAGFGSMGLIGNVARASAMSGFIDKIVTDNCDDKLEKAAIKLTDKMRSMIIRKECGLAANTDFTQSLKGGNIPLVDSGQLVANITYKMLDKGEASVGVTVQKVNRFRAAFVGVMRQGPMKSGGSLIGIQTAKELFNIAKRQVFGYTVVMPGSGAIKKVPARDFRKAPRDWFEQEFLEDMKDGVASGFSRMV